MSSKDRSYQPEKLSQMLPRLYVYVPQMAMKGALFPVGRSAPIIYRAEYSVLEGAEKGDLFVMHQDRPLHAIMTAMDDTLMVEMAAESAFIEQPLDYLRGQSD